MTKAAKKAEKPRSPVTTVKIKQSTRNHIMENARWNETVDDTLKRLLGITNGEGR